MQVIEYIKTNGLPQLCEKYDIAAKRHGKYENLVLLKYDQIDSPMGERIVQECRGLILDEANDWKVVSRPYDKFFNLGEGHAAEIDWKSASVYEKLDGSLMTLYFYADEWMVASSGSPDASGPVNNDSSMTFKDLFWQTWNELGYKLPTETKHCYMFELMTPYNRIIVPHSTNRLVLHGERSVGHTYKIPHFYPEHEPTITAVLQGWAMVNHFPITSAEEAVKASAALNPMGQEGFVVVDDRFNRVKIKSPQYVALAHMKDGFSDRRMIELVRTNESSEFLSYFPEYEPLYSKYHEKFETLASTLEQTYDRIKGIESQKEFALEATKVAGSGALFSLRAKKIPIRDSLAQMSIQSLEKLMS